MIMQGVNTRTKGMPGTRGYSKVEAQQTAKTRKSAHLLTLRPVESPSMHDPILSLSLHEPKLSLSMLLLDPNHPDWAC